MVDRHPSVGDSVQYFDNQLSQAPTAGIVTAVAEGDRVSLTLFPANACPVFREVSCRRPSRPFEFTLDMRLEPCWDFA